MKIVILAGGMGTRLSEFTDKIPKPMIDIGGLPIILHIIKYYNKFGFNEFIICTGYKSNIVKEYFYNYYLNQSDMTVNLNTNDIVLHKTKNENWKVTVVDTGLETLTAERLQKVKKYIGNETFGLTYCDGLSNIKLDKLLEFHKEHGKIVTLTAVQPKARFGSLEFNDNSELISFKEKVNDNIWINGGFLFCNKEIFDYLDDDMLEKNTLPQLLNDKNLMAFKHDDFWHCVDTSFDKKYVESLWNKGKAKWKVWE